MNQNLYKVTDPITNEEVLIGTAKECAAFLGLKSTSSFHSHVRSQNRKYNFEVIGHVKCNRKINDVQSKGTKKAKNSKREEKAEKRKKEGISYGQQQSRETIEMYARVDVDAVMKEINGER